MSNETEFVEGLIVKAPRDGAPDFVKAAISIKRQELIDWLQARTGDWVNVDVKESRAGKWYPAVNNYKPKDGPAVKRRADPGDTPNEPDFDQDELIPF